ncbi:MAG TPA: hypothetical protein VJ808_05155 [Gemmatimonadales bacterium]|nr:hypothetical protein [Gemmatimonadales bacterium]
MGLPGTVGPGEADFPACGSELVGRGQELANLPAEPGRGWHSLRRQFATGMKHAPLKDLCALGGWKSRQTVLTCYQRADSASMQQALAARRRLEA